MDQKIVLFLSILGLFHGSGARYMGAKHSKLKLVIDQDGGADDAVAIFMSLLYERYFNGMEVVALTTANGNVNESQGFENTQRFLDVAGRYDVPIYRGATESLVISVESDHFFGYNGLGDIELGDFKAIAAEKQHAAVALIELSKKYEGNLIVMAIGPLTNIALAQRLDPCFMGRLAQLYVGGGNIYSEQYPEPEFNAYLDVEAYRIMVNSASAEKVTIIPFSQIREYSNITRDWRENVLGAIDTPIIKALNTYERISIATSETWTLLDPAVAAIVLDINTVGEFRLSKNNITLCGTERGINSNILEAEDSNTRLVYSFKQEEYQKLLIDIFTAELNDCRRKRY